MKAKSNHTLWADKLKQLTPRLLICACLFAASAMQVATAQTRVEEEHLLKAAFIYNFAKFTRWPENILKGQDAQLNLCTAGEDRLVGELKRLAGRIIKEHPVTIVSLKNMPVPKNCHLLYIATSEKRGYKDILKSVRGEPVLTISELPHFSRSGGMIELYREKDQTRFIINLGIAREAELVLSSRLLSLAVVINNEEVQ
ncbi:MAG: YfiR family protein [Gammaproteobacteria bacterium]